MEQESNFLALIALHPYPGIFVAERRKGKFGLCLDAVGDTKLGCRRGKTVFYYITEAEIHD